MTSVPRPLSVAIVELIASFTTDGSRRNDALELLAGCDLGGWRVDGYQLFEAVDGTHVRFLIPQASVAVSLLPPGLPLIWLSLAVADDAGQPVLEVIETPEWIEVRHLQIGFGVTPALLRPLDPVQNAVSVTIDGSVRIGRDWAMTLVPAAAATLAPCEIVGTGVAVSLEEITFDLTAAVAHARSGSLRILPQCIFGGARGIAVNLFDVRLSPTGLSGIVRTNWALDHDGRTIAPSSAAVGHLLTPEWPIALESAELDFADNLPRSFSVAGALRVPFFDALLGVELGLASDTVGFLATLRVATLQALDVPLGVGRMRVASLVADGTIADDHFDINGALSGLELSFGPVAVSLAAAMLSIEHAPTHDRLRVALGRLPLGPLGTVDDVALVIESSDRPSGGWALRLEGGIAWADLQARLALPPGFPAPTGGRARASLIWEDDGAGGQRSIATISATVDDPSGLWDFVPATFRPQIEEANLDVEIVFPNAAAFASASPTAPLAGSASLSLLVQLPVLDTLAGILTVETGDARGRVRGSLRTTVDAGGTSHYSLEVTHPLSFELALPGLPRTGAPVLGLALEKVAVESGGAANQGSFRLAGTATLSAVQGYLGRLVAQLALPSGLASLLQQVSQALPDLGTFELALQYDGATASASIALAFRASNPPTFKLLEELGQLVNPHSQPVRGATPLPGLGEPQQFFEVTPGELRLTATLSNQPKVSLSGSLGTVVFDETFDMSMAIEIADDDFAISLRAGVTDPILVTAPVPDPTKVLGTADLRAIATTYGLTVNERQALAQVEQFLHDLSDDLGLQGVFAFEISDLGLTVTSNGPTVSGEIRLVQLPRFLDALTPLNKIKLELGAETDKIFIALALEGTNANDPLLTVPLPGDVTVDVYFNRFLLAYAWGRDELAFALDAAIVPSQTLDLTVGGTGIYLPAAKADVQAGATLTAPPVPIPEGLLSFERPRRPRNASAVDDLGLQAVVGVGRRRLVTAYLRELAFSPTYFLLWPGLRGDGGLVLGGPNPNERRSADDYLAVRNWDRGQFFARFTVKRGTVLFIPANVGVLLNPLAIVPPFITANPPYWLSPPLMMTDLYADEIGVSVNIPGLVFFDLAFERPLPAFSLQALLEFAALAAGGFTHPIPDDSVLRKIFFARLSVLLEIRLGGLSAAGTSASLVLEVNVADFVNGAIDLLQRGKATLDSGSNLLHEVERDPASLVRMIPRDARRLQHTIKLGGFTFSGSLHLLTPEELRDELLLFFENKRRKPRGLAANQPQQPPPRARPINLSPAMREAMSVTRQLVGDTRSIAPDVAVVAAKSLTAALAQQRARSDKIELLKRNRRDNVDEAARLIAGLLAKAGPAEVAARKKTLVALGLADAATTVEEAIAALVKHGTRTDERSIAAMLRSIVAQVLAKEDAATLADGVLAAPPRDIAADLISHTVRDPSSPTLVPLGERNAQIDRLVPGELDARRAIGDVFAKLERTISGLALPARKRAVADAQQAIEAVLTGRFGVQHQKVQGLASPVSDRAAFTARISTGALATWRTSARITNDDVTITTFDAKHFAGVMRGLDGFVPRTPDAADTVEEVVGYQIRLRSGGTFNVPLSSDTAAYKVELKGTRYQVLVRQKDQTWNAHDLPMTFVDSVPDGPGKAENLRDGLVIAPRTTRRRRTNAEKEAVKEQFEQSNDLYLTSVMARPEYQLKPSGGLHGPFFIGDLLRDPETGAYTVPSVPALLAGFHVSLLGTDLQLAGLAVPGAAGPSIFLYGHSTIDHAIGGLALHAQGDFVASAGPLWRSVPLPSGAVAPQNAIGFSGYVSLEQSGHKLLEGSASGQLTRAANGEVRASLKVRIACQGSADLGVSDAKFARVAWSIEGDVEVELTPGLVVNVGAAATVLVDLATYDTRWVVDVPAKTVCVPWYFVDSLVPPSGHWGSACATTPAVSHPEIDFGSVTWHRLAGGSCGVRAVMTNCSLSLELDLAALGTTVTNTLGVAKLALTNLL